MQDQKARKPLPEIARELGVEFVVEGSVMQIGRAVRIAAQLIDGARDQHLWAEKYEGDFSEILSLLDRTAAVCRIRGGQQNRPAIGILAGSSSERRSRRQPGLS